MKAAGQLDDRAKHLADCGRCPKSQRAPERGIEWLRAEIGADHAEECQEC